MKYLATLFFVGLLLGGCGSGEVIVADKPTTVMDTSIGSHAQSSVTNLDFGDVEAGLHLEVVVAEEDIPEGGKATELRSTASKQKLNMMTLDIEGPTPSALPITVRVEVKTDFRSNPVAIRGKLFREIVIGEREELLSFNTLAEAETARLKNIDPTQGPYPSQFSVDALTGLEKMPETMLLFVEAEAVLIGLETDKSTIDLATITGKPEEMGTLLSNPLRINFSQKGSEVETVSEEGSTENTPAAAGTPASTPPEAVPAAQ